MDRTHEKVVEAQFGSRAKAYVESAVHSQGADSMRSKPSSGRLSRRVRSTSVRAAVTFHI